MADLPTATIDAATTPKQEPLPPLPAVDLRKILFKLEPRKWSLPEMEFQNKLAALIKEAAGKGLEVDILLGLTANTLGRVYTMLPAYNFNMDYAKASIAVNFFTGTLQAEGEAKLAEAQRIKAEAERIAAEKAAAAAAAEAAKPKPTTPVATGMAALIAAMKAAAAAAAAKAGKK